MADQLEHDAEVKAQNDIAAQIIDSDSKLSAVPAGVKLRSKDVEAYPLTVSVVGGEFTFEGPGTTVPVSPEIAEQVTYLPNVEVVA